MPKELERRYRVISLDAKIRDDAEKVGIVQKYFEPVTPGHILRIRIETCRVWKNTIQRQAFVTVKKGTGFSREETQRNIRLRLAELLMSAAPYTLEKTRYLPRLKKPDTSGQKWMLDDFSSPLTGLVFAEVEVDSPERKIVFPTWLWEAVEVTDFVSNFDLAKIATNLKKSGLELGKGVLYPNELVDGIKGEGPPFVNEFVSNLLRN